MNTWRTVFSMAYAKCDFDRFTTKYRNVEDIAKMSDDDKRNTIIVELTDDSDLQAKTNCELEQMLTNNLASE
jgi:hypothetical protein